MTLSAEQSTSIEAEFKAFLVRLERSIGRLKLADLNRNPLLAAAFGPELMAEMLVNQRFERSTVTSFGSTLQNVARIVAGAASGSGTGGADLETTKGGVRYFVQVKTGPKTANKDIADSISSKLNSARARYGTGALGALGVCFGTLDAVNPIARKEFEARGIELWVGREFWANIGGDEGTMDEVLLLAAAASGSAEGLRLVFRQKAAELAIEFAKEIPNPDDAHHSE